MWKLYRKLIRQNRSLSEIADVFAFRADARADERGDLDRFGEELEAHGQGRCSAGECDEA